MDQGSLIIPQSMAVETTAHYHTVGELSKKTKTIIFALHGYGQTSAYMAGKFDWIDPKSEFVICPEALNAFYWGDERKPVACWMTKRHRYDEIEAFVGYLDQLYHRYCSHVNQETKIVFFSFSQGSATVWRWMHASQPRVNAVVNWAGWIPEDIGYTHLQEYFKEIDIYLHYGQEDEFINDDTVSRITDVIDENQLDVAVSKWPGKHHIPKPELIKFFESKSLRLVSTPA